MVYLTDDLFKSFFFPRYLLSVVLFIFIMRFFLNKTHYKRYRQWSTYSISKVETSRLQHTLLSNIYSFNITLLRIYEEYWQKKAFLFTFWVFFLFFNSMKKKFWTSYCDLKYNHHFLWRQRTYWMLNGEALWGKFCCSISHKSQCLWKLMKICENVLCLGYDQHLNQLKFAVTQALI